MGPTPAESSYNQRYGFDAQWRRQQLELLGLSECPEDSAGLLHGRVLGGGVAEQVVAAFFERLLDHEPARRLLSSFDVERLRHTQLDYLNSFGVDYASEAYFEQRLRVGIAHARVGVPLSLYLTAYSLLQSLILERVSRTELTPEQGRGVAAFVLRITALDIALATEVYHRAGVGALEDSVQRMRGEREELRQAMRTDDLTGVLNRATVMGQLQRALENARRTGQLLCVIMADLDHFKAVNDQHGHLVGDEVLRGVAARIKAAVREFDFVGRFGGEEFLLVLENTSLHTARQVAERVRRRVGDGPLRYESAEVVMTLSQGLTEARAGDAPEGLIDRADRAMYRAKQSGRNCVVVE
ncbi:MAG: diguanylate cyclase [Xanthomonadaceae bacterium]|nr:diguanylate cyclase [Xanthomonadaceae bacterium]